MEIKYRPPLNLPEECDYLEKNMLRCLNEKAAKDVVEGTRKCKPENLLWFFLECPNRSDKYDSKEGLREIFIKNKLKQLEDQ